MPQTLHQRPGEHIPNSHQSGALDTEFPGNTVGLWINAAGSISASMWSEKTEAFLKYTVTQGGYIRGNFRQVRTHADTTLSAGEFHVMVKVPPLLVD